MVDGSGKFSGHPESTAQPPEAEEDLVQALLDATGRLVERIHAVLQSADGSSRNAADLFDEALRRLWCAVGDNVRAGSASGVYNNVGGILTDANYRINNTAFDSSTSPTPVQEQLRDALETDGARADSLGMAWGERHHITVRIPRREDLADPDAADAAVAQCSMPAVSLPGDDGD